jgi:hypothetical protein
LHLPKIMHFGSSRFCSRHAIYIAEFDGPALSTIRRVIPEVKQHWSVMGWVKKNLLSRAPPCLGRHLKPLVSAAFTVVSTHQSALGPRGGLWRVLLMCNP